MNSKFLTNLSGEQMYIQYLFNDSQFLFTNSENIDGSKIYRYNIESKYFLKYKKYETVQDVLLNLFKGCVNYIKKRLFQNELKQQNELFKNRKFITMGEYISYFYQNFYTLITSIYKINVSKMKQIIPQIINQRKIDWIEFQFQMILQWNIQKDWLCRGIYQQYMILLVQTRLEFTMPLVVFYDYELKQQLIQTFFGYFIIQVNSDLVKKVMNWLEFFINEVNEVEVPVLFKSQYVYNEKLDFVGKQVFQYHY